MHGNAKCATIFERNTHAPKTFGQTQNIVFGAQEPIIQYAHTKHAKTYKSHLYTFPFRIR
jgi:hypothetical protein